MAKASEAIGALPRAFRRELMVRCAAAGWNSRCPGAAARWLTLAALMTAMGRRSTEWPPRLYFSALNVVFISTADARGSQPRSLRSGRLVA